MRRRNFYVPLIGAMTVFFTVTLGAVAIAETTGPTIASDQFNYAAGETVVLTGTGWQAGESVHIRVNDDEGETWGYDKDVVANDLGGFTDTLQLPGWFIALYTVTATGSSSGSVTTTFTDAAAFNVAFATSGLPAGTSVSVAYSGTNNGGNPQNGPVTFAAPGPTANTGFRASTSLTFSFPTPLTPTGQTCTLSSTSASSPYTTGEAGGSITITGTYNCVSDKQDQTITFGAIANKMYGDADFDPGATASSGLPVSYSAAGNCAIVSGKVRITGAGSCTVTASQAGDSSYNPAPDVPQSFNIAKADPGCAISGYTGVYDTFAHGAAGTCAASGSFDLGATFTNVPGGTANWTFTSSDPNYDNDSGSVAITIDKADAVCAVVGWSGTYDGDPHGAGGSCTGVKGETLAGLDLGASFTNVPGGTANWTFTDVTGNYNDDGGSVGIVISKADPDCSSIAGYTGTYDAAFHGASGTCEGVGTEGTLDGLDLGGTFKDVPGGTANWTFADVTGNYNDDSGSVSIDISKADPTCVVTGYTGVYDANPHGASGSCTGVEDEDLAGLDLGASFTNVPGGTASWTFTDVTGNYNDDSGSVAIEISKANAHCAVTGYSVVFDDATHTATGSCEGVLGETLGGLDLSGTSHKMPGVYSDTWTFTDVTGNYNDTSGTVTDTIIAWTLRGFYAPVDMNGVYNTVKNGSTVPLKFEIFAGSTELTGVSAVKSFTAAMVSCDAGVGTDEVEVTTTGGTTLRYDASAGQFIQNWQTPKTAGKCYRVTMTTQDLSTLVALFRLK